jgi:replicative DNA helicase
MPEYTLPIDGDAEKHLIGSVWSGLGIEDPAAREAVWNVPTEAFFIAEHRRIWAGIQKLSLLPGIPSEMSLLWEISQSGHSDAAARSALLEVLNCGADVQPAGLAARVQEMHSRRIAIHAADEVRAAALDLNIPQDEVQTKANIAFLSIAKGSGGAPKFFSSSELIQRVEYGEPIRAKDAGEKLWYSGIDWLDDLIVAGPGNVILIGARPGMGKTGLAVQARNVTASRGIPSAIMSLEMDKSEIEARDAAWWMSDPKAGRVFSYKAMLKGHYDAAQALAILHHRVPEMSNAYGWAHPSNIAVGKLCAYITEAVHLYGVRSVAVDYFQYIKPERQKGDTLASAYAANSGALKQLAQELRICLVVLSQLNRETEGRQRPCLADFKETSQLEQDAQVAIMPYRNKDDEPMLTIPKHRDGETVLERPLDVCWPCLRFAALDRMTDGTQGTLY